MATSRARAGHARTKRAGVASRALAALAVVATAASTLVVSQVAAPQAAQAAQEPVASKLDVGEVSVWINGGYTSETEGGAPLNDRIRYGVVTGISRAGHHVSLCCEIVFMGVRCQDDEPRADKMCRRKSLFQCNTSSIGIPS